MDMVSCEMGQNGMMIISNDSQMNNRTNRNTVIYYHSNHDYLFDALSSYHG
jgi:hypothetical protein